LKSARETADTGATEFCIVAAVRGPDARLLSQVRDGIKAIRADGNDIQIACSLGMLTQQQVDELVAMGVHPLTTTTSRPRSRTSANVVTTQLLGGASGGRCGWCARRAWRSAAAGIIGMGESLEQARRVRLAARGAEPRRVHDELPDRPAWHAVRELPGGRGQGRAAHGGRVPGWPCRVPSCASPAGRELTFGDLGTKQGMLGGINAIIVGNYLTNLGRAAAQDLEMLDELQMPIKALNQSL